MIPAAQGNCICTPLRVWNLSASVYHFKAHQKAATNSQGSLLHCLHRARGSEAQHAEAAARHQVRSRIWGKKKLGNLIPGVYRNFSHTGGVSTKTPHTGVYLGIKGVYLRDKGGLSSVQTPHTGGLSRDKGGFIV